MTHRPILTALLALAPACAAPDDPATSVVTSEIADCEDIICGNSPLLGGQPFWELDQSKTSFSPVGNFRIKSFKTAGNVDLKPWVSGFGLIGLTATKKYELKELEGSKLVIESAGGANYELTIEQVGKLWFFERGNDSTEIPTYLWHYSQVSGSPWADAPPGKIEFLCPSDNINHGEKDAIVFAGDRYSKATGKVSAIGTEVGPWFNIACNNDALWKLAAFRFVEAARKPLIYDTDESERDAALMAIRADYCGNNHPWTDLGTDVDWANRGRWLWIDKAKYKNVEAIWDKDKAFCLSHPRKHTIDEIDCWPEPATHFCTPEQIDNWVEDGHLMITYVP